MISLPMWGKFWSSLSQVKGTGPMGPPNLRYTHNLYRWAKGKRFQNYILRVHNFIWESVKSFRNSNLGCTLQVINITSKQVGCSLQGVLVQAKNGDKLFWEEKFHTANGKAQACTQGALALFPFKFEGGRGSIPWFPMCLDMFPMGSHQVPNVFPTCSPQHLTFIPYVLMNVVLLSPYRWAKGKELYT